MYTSTLEYSTMRTDHRCRSLYKAYTIDQLVGALRHSDRAIIVGAGSNILFVDDVDADLIAMRMTGREVIMVDQQNVQLILGAGEDWHQIVLWTIRNGWGGLENLSLIPGRCGAAPIQNIGAYGVELKDSLQWVEVLDRDTFELSRLSVQECQLGYRDSIFKHELKDKVVITRICLHLTMEGHHVLHTSYGDIKERLRTMGVRQPSIADVSKAVIHIRSEKLPDPQVLPNNGSFFKNPILSTATFQSVRAAYPDMPYYEIGGGHIKIPAAWLIQHAGCKGIRIGHVGTYSHQPLVIVNYGTSNGQDIRDFSAMIQDSVKDRYGITLQPEVNIYPS